MERLPEDTELDRCRKFVEFWEGCTQLQGLAQSNSNARLNNSAKHVAMLLETIETCKGSKGGGTLVCSCLERKTSAQIKVAHNNRNSSFQNLTI
jgi:hypothetical protein